MHAGDSHTMALTQQGFVYGWGTFRNSSGVFSFSAQERLALLPVLVYSPDAAVRQAVKIVSGQDTRNHRLLRSCYFIPEVLIKGLDACSLCQLTAEARHHRRAREQR